MAATSPPARGSAACAPPRSSAISAPARKPRSRRSRQKPGCSSGSKSSRPWRWETDPDLRRRQRPDAGGALMLEQPALALDAAAIAGQRAVGTDDAVAGYDDADRVGAVGEADGPHRPRPADTPRELAIGDRRAARDVAQRAPHRALERRAGGLHRHIVDGREIAGEIGVQDMRKTARVARRLEHEAS